MDIPALSRRFFCLWKSSLVGIARLTGKHGDLGSHPCNVLFSLITSIKTALQLGRRHLQGSTRTPSKAGLPNAHSQLALKLEERLISLRHLHQVQAGGLNYKNSFILEICGHAGVAPPPAAGGLEHNVVNTGNSHPQDEGVPC